MSAEKQLVDCVLNTRGFIQTYFFIYSIDKLKKKKSIFKGYLKKPIISSYYKCFTSLFSQNRFQ